MLDYHLHLWPHGQRDRVPTVEEVAAYCERAGAAGVGEIALTEHLFRFAQADALLGGWWDAEPDAALRSSMAAYWAEHARADLDAYVACVQECQAAGLPVVLGLEVDYYPGRMDRVAALLAGYPFDVLLGSVHWLGTWRFDDLDDGVSAVEWDRRSAEAVWDAYTRAIEELAATGTCDVLAHLDLVKVAGRRPPVPDEWWDRLCEAAAASGMAVEVSSAGWRKPAAEAYPAPPLLDRLVRSGVPLTTASDAHGLADVADRAGDIARWLAGAGVTHLQAYRSRQPRPVPLGPVAGGDGPLDPPGAAGAPAPARAEGAPARGGEGARAAVPVGTGDRPASVAADPAAAGIAPGALAARHTVLDGDALAHLQRLLGTWGVLADLSFSDMVMMAPAVDGAADGGRLVVLGQMRPTTTATMVPGDLVGSVVADDDWPVVVEALGTGEIRSGVGPLPPVVLPVQPPGPGETGEIPAVPGEARIEAVPVPVAGRVVAAVVRIAPLEHGRRSGRLERVYRGLYDRLAAMVTDGRFPSPGEETLGEDAPRVGDGLVLVDAEGRIVYSSPNAMSALHRMGVMSVPEGHRLGELGVDDTAVDRALATGRPVIEEVERRPDVIVLVHCTPLVAEGEVTGAMVLMRDVTDLRRLDRLLLSKDAAIREVHHRVKNNLQTISSLLSLQARRLQAGAGREALREAERRVRSIALVHEVLSREPGEEIPFHEIVDSLVRMAEDSVVAGHAVTIEVTGDLGAVPADVATPLAVVLAELLQNAVEHAFGEAPGPDGGRVDVRMDAHHGVLHVEVVDDGCGLPRGFAIDRTTSLGLSIVRDLVTSQLGGTITMVSPAAAAPGPAATAEGRATGTAPGGGPPAADRPGTRVELTVPLRRR